MATGKRLIPYLELCCLRIRTNFSYANAESDIEMLTDMSVSDNTQQRLVQHTEFPDPVAAEPLTEACKVKARTSATKC